jgi:ketosteroid isomerase-like protein
MSQVLSQWKAAFDGHRPAAMAELFADGALFQGFGPEPTSGRDAVRACYAAVAAYRKLGHAVVATSRTIPPPTTRASSRSRVTSPTRPPPNG